MLRRWRGQEESTGRRMSLPSYQHGHNEYRSNKGGDVDLPRGINCRSMKLAIVFEIDVTSGHGGICFCISAIITRSFQTHKHQRLMTEEAGEEQCCAFHSSPRGWAAKRYHLNVASIPPGVSSISATDGWFQFVKRQDQEDIQESEQAA